MIDIKINKSIEAVIHDSTGKESLYLKFSKFREKERNIPGVIEIQDSRKNMNARIVIKKTRINWDGAIEFIPGTGYRKERIK
jgi:hypothetical protein